MNTSAVVNVIKAKATSGGVIEYGGSILDSVTFSQDVCNVIMSVDGIMSSSGTKQILAGQPWYPTVEGDLPISPIYVSHRCIHFDCSHGKEVEMSFAFKDIQGMEQKAYVNRMHIRRVWCGEHRYRWVKIYKGKIEYYDEPLDEDHGRMKRANRGKSCAHCDSVHLHAHDPQ